MVNLDKASFPPTTTLSIKPLFIILAPSIMLFADEEQAVEMVLTYAGFPQCFAIIFVTVPKS